MRRQNAAALGLAALVLLAGASDLFADDTLSPRLTALTATAGDPGAVESFWAEVEKTGTPLVEKVEGDDQAYWVTFLWRRHREAESTTDRSGSVLVLGLGSSSKFTDEVMLQVEGTDVLYRTYKRRRGFRGSYQLSPNDPLTLPDLSDPGWWPRRLETFQSDPLNPRSFGPRHSFFELPGAPPQPWIEQREGVARGRVVEHAGFASEVLANERDVSVYLPPGYDSRSGLPLVVLFDRGAYLNQVPTPTILDNLIAESKLPPLVAVLVGNAPGQRNSELPCNPQFADFLAKELFPWVRKEYEVTSDPKLTVIGGSSFGGLASSYFAMEHPEIVGNVLSQSGSYWWADGWDFREPDPALEGEWLTRQFAARPRSDLRFYMDVGIYEAGNPSMAVVNRHLRDVLRAKGYEIVKYVEFVGGHDYVVWRGTLADGLMALLGKTTG